MSRTPAPSRHPIPGDPHTARALTRRGLLGVALAGVASSCSANGGSQPEGRSVSSAPVADPGGGTDRIVWANWPDYLDVAGGGKKHPTLDAFVRRSRVPVDYREVINDNEEYVDSISTALDAGRPVGCDVMTLTSWMAARLVGEELVQPLGEVPHGQNVIDALASPDWDPGNVFSLPWQAGLTGIAYDARRVDRAIGSVTELLTRPDLKGRVGLLTEFSDTVGLVLLANGRDLGEVSALDVDSALDSLAEATAAGRFAGYYGNEVVDALAGGDVAACLAWSGDILQAQHDNPYLKFVVPEEGLMIWADNFVVPKASPHAAQVAQLVDYFYRPAVAAKVAAWVNYICPVEGAQASMERIDPDLAQSPLIFPDSSILDVSYQFPTLPAADDARQRARFAGLAASPGG